MTFADALWGVVGFTLVIMFIAMFIMAFGDVFRRDDLSGWSKAGWAIVLLALPLVGVLAYVIVRPKGAAPARYGGEFPSDRIQPMR
jgi:hypothetical protein